MSITVHAGDALTRRRRLSYVLVLGALTALGPFTVDLYLPAFPALSGTFGVSTATIQLTLTATTVGFAVGQLIVGPWSDRVGRRLPLILATAVHVLASLGVALAPDMAMLSAFRVLQGVGAAAGGVVAMAIVRDLFGGRPLVKMLSRLALVNGLAPVLAPVIGSQLLAVLDWRGIFFVLAAYGLFVVLASIFFIVETLPVGERAAMSKVSVWQSYRAVFSDRIFVGIAVIASMSQAGLFAYLAASPFVFQEVFGLNAQEYGLLFAINSVGIVTGVQVGARLSRRIGPQWILAFSTATMMLAGVGIVVADQLGLGLLGVLIPLFVYITACGFGTPLTQVLGLVNHGNQAGTAASVLGALSLGLAGLMAPVVGMLGQSAVPMGAMMAVTSLVAMVALWVVVRPDTVPALAD